MGYESHWSGEIRIEPPLTWGEIKNEQKGRLRDTQLRLIEEIEETGTGQIRTVTSDAVVPATTGLANGYEIEGEIQAVVDAYPGHTFTGAIVARPADPGGIPWRYVVHGRCTVRQEAILVWPGDHEEVGQT